MIKLYETGAYYADGKLIPDDGHAAEALAAMGRAVPKEEARKRTIAYSILEAHNTSGNMDDLKIKFDAMAAVACSSRNPRSSRRSTRWRSSSRRCAKTMKSRGIRYER